MKNLLLFVFASILSTNAFAFDLMAWSMDSTYQKDYSLTAFNITGYFHGSCDGENLISSLAESDNDSPRNLKGSFVGFKFQTVAKCKNQNFSGIYLRKTPEDTYRISFSANADCRAANLAKCPVNYSNEVAIICRVTKTTKTMNSGVQPFEVTCRFPDDRGFPYNQGTIKFNVK